ncbi:hypothetical protein [Prevotella pallens]|uniref:hypothetical protein n=1 Tax=Prevotella pallens TaxID=60133 RepID=UPI0028F000F4|nr:hypothetical protein [Prevotella pallens]
MSTFRRRLMMQAAQRYVKFEDPEFERICIAKWDKDGDGKLSKDEALQVVKIENKMFEDNKLLQSADFDIFKNLTKMNGGLMFRNSSVKKSKMNNITSIDEVHITLDTTDLFLSFNSLRKLPDTESSNAILDGYSSRIRMNNIEYIGENSIQDAEYIILGVDKIPELKENCSFKRVFVKNDMVSFFKEHSSWSKYDIHPISELVNLYPSHGDVWKKM